MRDVKSDLMDLILSNERFLVSYDRDTHLGIYQIPLDESYGIKVVARYVPSKVIPELQGTYDIISYEGVEVDA